ncbi:DUF3991 domain-containing protein [Staphylococcus pseudintermedius]|nr:DUF3991 domain-containing protein [Staphylococcus pseudintermedius]EGQ4238831.1 DUF3991 domain-containing protein [Staphylococcus pseudintermedius]
MSKNHRVFTDEEKAKARDVDIREIGEQNGLSFRKQGKYDRCNEHDSLILKGQSFYWNSTGKKGHGALSFAVEVLDMDFKDAMKMLVDSKYGQYDASKVVENEQKALNYDTKYEVENPQIARDYLINERGLDERLVDWAFRTGVVAQDGFNNVCFKWLDNENNIVGADKRGTGEKPFKQVVQGSKEHGGFHIDILQDKNKGIKNIVFTESPIDALSYYDAHRDLQQTRIASLSGLKLESLKEHLIEVAKYNIIKGEHPKDYPINSIVLAVDNDLAGKNFVRNVVNSFETEFKLDLPSERKDWNEQLKKDKAITNGVPTYEKPKEAKEQVKILDQQNDEEMER